MAPAGPLQGMIWYGHEMLHGFTDWTATVATAALAGLQLVPAPRVDGRPC